jgi:GNAT superfamily N-acetyltransferase
MPDGGRVTRSSDASGQVRVAGPEDLVSVRRVVERAFGPYLDEMDRPPAPMLFDYAAAAARSDLWVTGDPIAGTVTLVADPDRLWIENLAVDPAMHGFGFGRLLIEHAEREARRRGLGVVALYTNVVMRDSLAVYEYLGFDEIERRTDDGYRRVFLEKRLGS